MSVDEKIRQLETELEHLKSLVRASRLINSTLDFDELMEIIRKTAIKELGADKATIYFADAEKEEIHSAYLEDKFLSINLPFGTGIAGHVAKTGESLIIDDAQNDDRFFKKIDEVSGYVTNTMLCVPMNNNEEKLMGVFQVLNSHNGKFSNGDMRFLEDLSIQGAIAIENARLYAELKEKKRLEHELDLAREIQSRLLPGEPPEVGGFDVAATNIPAQQVSGDYYDYFFDDKENLHFVIGDVSGKGISAALLMASLQASCRSSRSSVISPPEFTRLLNRHIHRSTSKSKYITFFSAVLHQEDNTVVYCNAGHNPPLLCRKTGEVEELAEGGIPLGFMPDFEYSGGSVSLEPGDVLVLFSDGVTEAMNEDEEEFGPERLADIIRRGKELICEKLIEQVLEAMTEHADANIHDDDITMLLLKRID